MEDADCVEAVIFYFLSFRDHLVRILPQHSQHSVVYLNDVAATRAVSVLATLTNSQVYDILALGGNG